MTASIASRSVQPVNAVPALTMLLGYDMNKTACMLEYGLMTKNLLEVSTISVTKACTIQTTSQHDRSNRLATKLKLLPNLAVLWL